MRKIKPERPKLNKMQMVSALVAALATLGRDKEAANVTHCSAFWRVFGHRACGTIRLFNIRCNHPLCPMCARDRCEPLRRRLKAYFEASRHHKEFLTLTVVNVAQIDRAYVDWLLESFKKLRATRAWGAWVIGGVYAVDTTYNHITSTWHVHIHAIIELRALSQRDWREKWYMRFTQDVRAEWQRITGSWVIHLRKVNPRAVNELIKYEAKAAGFVFKPELVGEYLDAFKNVRRIQTFGSMFNVKVDEDNEFSWACPCGNRAFHEWVPLGNAWPDEVEEDATGQMVLKYPGIWWDLHGGEGESPPGPLPDFIPPPEQAALFYRQEVLAF